MKTNKQRVIQIVLMIIILFLVVVPISMKNTEKNKKLKSKEITKNTKETSKKEKEEEQNIFKKYNNRAKEYLSTLTLEEKIGQLLLVRLPNIEELEDIKQYNLSGYVLYKKDFQDKTKEEVISMIENLGKNQKTPLLIATDEEGGTVVRVSANEKLVKEKFKSSQELYKIGGFEEIKKDTINKSNVLEELKINVNLAPVADVSTNENDYIYNRSFGQDTENTTKYIETVIKSSKQGKVSYVLKHFPGYSNNIDTHKDVSIDDKSYDEIMKNDIPPFKKGIENGAEAVLVSHNIVNSIEKDVPASLSKNVNKLLREDLKFSGVIMTDDLDMGAITKYKTEPIIKKAILAGNNLLIVTNYKESIEEIKKAIDNKEISTKKLDERILKVIEWKFYKGLIK